MGEISKNLRLDASELDAIRFARASAADIIRGLVIIATSSKSESQRRQASEVVLKYALADREQQFNVDGKPVAGTTINNITMTKVDLQLNVAMELLTPQEKVIVAEALEIVERVSAAQGLELIEGSVSDSPGTIMGPTCKCGCGTPVNKYTQGPKRGQWATWARGHHKRNRPPEEVERDKENLKKARMARKMNAAAKGTL